MGGEKIYGQATRFDIPIATVSLTGGARAVRAQGAFVDSETRGPSPNLIREANPTTLYHQPTLNEITYLGQFNFRFDRRARTAWVSGCRIPYAQLPLAGVERDQLTRTILANLGPSFKTLLRNSRQTLETLAVEAVNPLYPAPSWAELLDDLGFTRDGKFFMLRVNLPRQKGSFQYIPLSPPPTISPALRERLRQLKARKNGQT